MRKQLPIFPEHIIRDNFHFVREFQSRLFLVTIPKPIRPEDDDMAYNQIIKAFNQPSLTSENFWLSLQHSTYEIIEMHGALTFDEANLTEIDLRLTTDTVIVD